MLEAGGSSLLGRIDTTQLRFAHPQLPRQVAEWLGCASLQVCASVNIYVVCICMCIQGVECVWGGVIGAVPLS